METYTHRIDNQILEVVQFVQFKKRFWLSKPDFAKTKTLKKLPSFL